MRELRYELAGKRVWIPGHTGMVGSALVRRLANAGCEVLVESHAKLDLRRQQDVEDWMARNRPQAVFMCAATVGGILANDSRPADFIYDNLAISLHIIQSAGRNGVEKLMFLGSSCFYPREAEQPMREDSLLTGPIETTNQWYAVAKIAGAKLCQAYRRQHNNDFISVVPTNLYGPGDNFDPSASHVVSAMIRKVHEAKAHGRGQVEIWGTGTPRREFMYVDDAADAMVFLMEGYSSEDIINVGTGEDVSITELAHMVAGVVGYEGEFEYATDKPDGMPRKSLDARRVLEMGWSPQTSLREGLESTYAWFLEEGA